MPSAAGPTGWPFATQLKADAPTEWPSPADPPSGCVFHTRCPRFIGDICKNEEPELKEVEPGHFWRCHHPVEELRELQKTAPPERGQETSGPRAAAAAGENGP